MHATNTFTEQLISDVWYVTRMEPLSRTQFKKMYLDRSKLFGHVLEVSAYLTVTSPHSCLM